MWCCIIFLASRDKLRNAFSMLWNVFEKCKLECDKAKQHRIAFAYTFQAARGKKENSVHVLVSWIKKSCGRRRRRKIETFLISPLHCTKCKMRNEKEKLFCSLSAPKSFDFDCLPVTLNLYFSIRLWASFQSLKHFLCYLCNFLSNPPMMIDHQPCKIHVCALNKFIVHLAPSIAESSSFNGQSLRGNLALVVLQHFPGFFARKSLVRPHWNDKRLCIHQVYISMELFNFPFDVVVVVSPLIIIRSR